MRRFAPTLSAITGSGVRLHRNAQEGRRLKGQKKSKKRKRLSIGTLNRNLGVVSAILNLCAELWRDEHTNLTWLEMAPKIKLLDDPDRRPPYPISWEEQDLLFAQLTELLKDMCEFKVNSGLRDQAVCGLRWSWEQRVPELDSDGIKRTVFVIPSRRNRKSRQPHVVVLNDIAQAIVEKYRGQDANYVFTRVNHKGERKRIGAIGNTGWRAARRRASARYPAVLGTPAPVGFRRLRVHDLKHTFGGRLRAAGVSKEDRKDLLGHRHKDITTDYSAAQLRQLLDCANRVVRRPGNTPMLTVLRVTMESDLPAEDWRTPANLPQEKQVSRQM